jgi:hypothetical protein
MLSAPVGTRTYVAFERLGTRILARFVLRFVIPAKYVFSQM